MYYRLFIILISLGNTCDSFCQSFNEKDFIRLSTKNGLNDNYINGIVQDEQGHIWIANEGGLNMYDGHAFTDHASTLNKNSISSYIRGIKKFPSGYLGLISLNGFYLLNTKDLAVKKFRVPDNTPFTTYLNHAWDAALIAKNSIAVTTSTGFYVYNDQGNLLFRYDAYKPEDANKKSIRYGRNIFSINDREYIVYFTNYGTAYYDAEKKHYRVVDPSEENFKFFAPPSTPVADHWLTRYQLSPHEFIFIPAATDSIAYYDHNTKRTVKSFLPFHTAKELNYQSKIARLSDSSFVLNSSNGGFWLLKFNKQTGKITCDGKNHLTGYKINCLFVDKEHRLWIGTPEGLLQQKLNSPFLHVFSFTPQMVKDSVQKNLSCAYRYKDKLYVGRYARKSGLVILDTVTLKPVKTLDFFSSDNEFNELFSMEMYHKDTLWLGTTGGLIWFDTKTNNYGKIDDNRFSEQIRKLNILSPVGKDGQAWLCALLGGMAAQYDPATRQFRFFTSDTDPPIPFTRIKQIVYDANGDTWLSGHALARWNNQRQTFDTVINIYGGPNKFNDNILTINADDKGSLWLHNVENGLLEYQVASKRFIHYGMNEGMSSNDIESLSPAVNNTLWIAQRSSLNRFDLATKKIKSYGYHDELPLHKPTSSEIYYDPATNTCYLLCKNEIVRFEFDPKEAKDNSSDLFIQKMIVNNDKVFFNPGENLWLKPNENNFVIHYAVIDFESGNDYNFAYRLGKTKTWINVGKQRVITLANLSPGTHSLELKAIARSGSEKIKELRFTISPPFWKTKWFIGITILLIAGLLYMLYRSRIRQIRQKSDIDKMLAQTEMKALHAQMNPHFIFNCLNSIREMILNTENEQASLYLSKFARLIRITLNQSSKQFVTLTDTIDYLERYIEMEKIRSSHFFYTIRVDKDLQTDEIMVPPMLIQPFIENAIWHGTPNKKEMHIAISFDKSDHKLVCKVEDNGIGIKESLKKKEALPNEQSVGIANIRQRIELLNEKYNLQSAVEVVDKSTLSTANGTGTIVTLHLPIKTNDSLWTT